MKVASLRDGGPDGRLVAVSDDLATARFCAERSFQEALDLGSVTPEGPQMPFDPAACAAPLPRAFQFLDGSAYVNHVALVRQARGAKMPERFWTDPLMYQGGSDCPQGPQEDIPSKPEWGTDFEAEIAVITGPVPRGTARDAAAAAIRFVMLCNDVSLRALIPDELSKGFGFVQSKPPCAFSPVAVAVADYPGWRDGKLHGTLRVDLNGAAFGRADAGIDMTFDFPQLVAHAARTRPLGAGTIIGSGTVSNRHNGGPGRPVAEGGAGYSCIAEQRMVETILSGEARTGFLQPGDMVRIWMEDAAGRSIFGDIAQRVVAG